MSIGEQEGHLHTRRLSVRIVQYTILCSVVFALLVSAVQLYVEYRRDMQTVHENFHFIEQSYVPAIAASSYKMDNEQLSLQLQGVLQLQDITYLEVTEQRGDESYHISAGDPNVDRERIRQFPLLYPRETTHVPVGTLLVKADVARVYQRFQERVLIVLITTLVSTFLMALLFLSIIQYVVTNHVSVMAQYTQNINFTDTGHALVLKHRHLRSSSHDELDQLVSAINEMRELVIHDMTQQQETQAVIEASLQEKEVLLRELYHRTKNTLQVIRSMLILQAATMPKNAQVQKLVKDTENRIMAMALVHQKLYQSQDLSRIPMHDYIPELTELIRQSYAAESQHISLVTEIEPFTLLLDTAIPCGLILNELLSNAMKYAFPGHRSGEIVIQLLRNDSGKITIVFADNGVGVSPEFDFRAQETLGLQTVITIAEHQLQGHVTFSGAQGVTCTIEFPETLYSARV